MHTASRGCSRCRVNGAGILADHAFIAHPHHVSWEQVKRKRREREGLDAKEAEGRCRCGHSRVRHTDPPGAQCSDCPEDGEGGWRHAFTPDAAEGGEILADPAMQESLEQLQRGEKGPALTAEEEAPGWHLLSECQDEQGCSMHGLNEAPVAPSRRPPVAVAYGVEGGALFEVLVPGDATVAALEGRLVITHARQVAGIVQIKPYGAEKED